MTRRPAKFAAIGVVAVLASAGCAESGSGGGGAAAAGGDGVEFGASKADYIEAFESVDPIALNAQAVQPKGAVNGRAIEEYVAALEEWSGGKIEVELSFSSAIAPVPEVDNAFVDGRLDMGITAPMYEPSEYPATNVLVSGASLLGNQGATRGVLESAAWPNQLALDSEALMSELEEHGVRPLVPFLPNGPSVTMCSSEGRDLDAFNGRQIGVAGEAQASQAEALGASPATVVTPEVFEGLQRGAIDCSVQSAPGTVLSGGIPVAPHLTIDPELGMPSAWGSWSFSSATWDTLPVVAQQLILDRLDVFYESHVKNNIWAAIQQMVEQVEEAGGTIGPFEADARDVIEETRQEAVAELGDGEVLDDQSAFVEEMQAAAEQWRQEVEQLDVVEDVAYEDFTSWFAESQVDLKPYVEKLMDEVYLPHRPS